MEPEYKVGKSYKQGSRTIRKVHGPNTPNITDMTLPPRKQIREVPAAGYKISAHYTKWAPQNRVKKFGRQA